MKVIPQVNKLPVRNLDSECEPFCDSLPKHGPLFPSSIRGIITGPSGSGKTNAMLSLLTEPNGLRFENIYIYSKSLHQPKYQFLENVLSGIQGIGYYTYSDKDNIIDPSRAKPNSIFIFDDVLCDKQNVMTAYFTMGRHRDVDSFYLCQTYSRVPKQLIRDNTNFLVLFKMDECNLRHVYNDHVGMEMKYEKFREICSECWKDKYGFVTIVKDWNESSGRYRKGFDQYIPLQKQ